MQTGTNEENQPSQLTTDELVRTELKGKFLAIERYDSMLWRIRSGYVLVLYGALSLLGVQWRDLIASPERDALLLVAFLLIFGFSACAAIIDFGFIWAKLRVVSDNNELTNIVLEASHGKKPLTAMVDELKSRQLLQISGESMKRVSRRDLWNAARFVLPLYLVTPVLAILIYLYLLITS
jgi:hypothetical protein